MYRLFISKHFKHELKPLAKKFPSLLNDVIEVAKFFSPVSNISLGEDVYKVRIRTHDLPKGKSSSFRLIILLVEIDNIIAPLTIYSKSNQENISKQAIFKHVSAVRAEL